MSGIIPVMDTIHTRVRNSGRLWAKGNYEEKRDIYKRNRYKVEQVIGIVKSRFGDRDKTKDFHVASLYVLARFVLYNLIILVERSRVGRFWLCFLSTLLELAFKRPLPATHGL
jgi:hypothetical protein